MMSAVDIASFEATNFQFDIEENRRRRAELANDVTELISISKFFLKHYSSDAGNDLPTPKPIITKNEKNAANMSKAQARLTNHNSKKAVANATATPVKRKQTRINNVRGRQPRTNIDDIPPLFDKIKLHEYCVDIVDRFFHGPPPIDSERSIAPKRNENIKEAVEKSVQTNPCEAVKKAKSKYATVASRYMNQTRPKSTNETANRRNASPYKLVSAKSLEILEEVARKGTEIKRHSCLTHPNAKERHSIERRDFKLTHQDNGSIGLKFRDIHPSIELVPSNSIFPKRVLKNLQATSSTDEKKISPKVLETPKTPNGSADTPKYSETVKCAEKPNENKTVVVSSSETIQCKATSPKSLDKNELQMKELPRMSIKPATKCEIENIYEIEIKPDDSKSVRLFPREKNQVIEMVHESEQEGQSEEIASPKSKLRVSFSDQSSGVTLEDTRESTNFDSSLLNSSTTLTDDEKYQWDKKSNESSNFMPIAPTSAKKLIDQILEEEEFEEGPLTSTAPPTERKIQRPADNFSELREILRRIRDDKTTLEVALDAEEPPEFLSVPSTHRDRQVQCDILPTLTLDNLMIDSSTPHHSRNTQSTDCSSTASKILESPKFTKTIESIRASARKLDFKTIDSEYRGATRKQIERAAKKFLKSILKNADADVPSENGSHLKVKKQQYHIVDDQIIQSNFTVNVSHDGNTSSSSSDATSLQLRLPSARLMMTASKCTNWIDRTDSDFTPISIDRNPFGDKRSELTVLHESEDYMSDGEILSEGEFLFS